MSLIVKAFRLAAAVLNAAANLAEHKGDHGDGRAESAERFNRQLAWQTERARRTSLLLAMSQRIAQTGNLRAWDALRAIDPCTCGNANCRCRHDY